MLASSRVELAADSTSPGHLIAHRCPRQWPAATRGQPARLFDLPTGSRAVSSGASLLVAKDYHHDFGVHQFVRRSSDPRDQRRSNDTGDPRARTVPPTRRRRDRTNALVELKIKGLRALQPSGDQGGSPKISMPGPATCRTPRLPAQGAAARGLQTPRPPGARAPRDVARLGPPLPHPIIRRVRQAHREALGGRSMPPSSTGCRTHRGVREHAHPAPHASGLRLPHPNALIGLAMLKLGGYCPPLPGRVSPDEAEEPKKMRSTTANLM
jgi:hypothetical protein